MPCWPKWRKEEIQSQSPMRSEEHTSELQSQSNLVCRLLLEKKKNSRGQKCSPPIMFRDNPMKNAILTLSLVGILIFSVPTLAHQHRSHRSKDAHIVPKISMP